MKINSAKTGKKQKPIRTGWRGWFLIIGFFITPVLNAQTTVDRIVAQVNDDIITLTELNQVMEPYVEKIKSMGYPELREQQMLYKMRTEMIDELIANKLTDQVARKKGVSISEGDVDNAIESIKSKNALTDEQFRKAIAEEGQTMAEYRKSIREQMLRSRLLNQEVQSKIVITTEDIKAYYQKHPDKYGGKEKYHLKTIVKKVPSFTDEDQLQSIERTLEGIIAKLDREENVSFSELAAKHSDLLAEEGGDIGKFALDELSKEIKTYIQDLEPGEHTPVIQTSQGLQIFYLQEIVQEEGVPLESVQDEIQEILYKEVVDNKFEEWVSNLREKAHIKIIQ